MSKMKTERQELQILEMKIKLQEFETARQHIISRLAQLDQLIKEYKEALK